MTPGPDARLVLEDGTTFHGRSFGFPRSTSGEVVFNTGMVGYNESLTDPSYAGQVLCLTYPLIGNYGVPGKILENGLIRNFESHKIQVQALVVNCYSGAFSHHAAAKSLADWLNEEKIPAMAGIDVRALTKILRENGTMLGKIIIDGKDTELHDPNAVNLVADVSIHKPIVYGKHGKKVLLVDCGAKNNIIQSLLARGMRVIRVPWDYDYMSKGCEFDFDGVLVSNGPGDPKACVATIDGMRRAIADERNIFGICLGNQLLALAAGADTYKLKYGHRGQNQPAYIVGEKRCFITSQNHGFAVNEATLPQGWEPWMRNANDDTNEGIRHKSKPFFSVQFHPEANPGPTDTAFLFDDFLKVIK
ncbi:MAG: glutamine-hydrolyzing carbamoyl-phosphate synthase small subunit [Candidatus Diapherotrites archaeon]|uniref:Carbamoyl phosphate synthase small chain n=1 Tax=Candidatus Iainarchaeum sp. TaxID=3101447 RepID=A0A8T3YIL8_9ARCH|nr:glutamine-hydrolyzing carbamoyl-phosphate synthase small subunit [Candidatus Diapherotrites archaeon]